MSEVILSPHEENELYVLLKPREAGLPGALADLLRRLEKSLFDRLTIEELEQLSRRFASDR